MVTEEYDPSPESLVSAQARAQAVTRLCLADLPGEAALGTPDLGTTCVSLEGVSCKQGLDPSPPARFLYICIIYPGTTCSGPISYDSVPSTRRPTRSPPSTNVSVRTEEG